MSYSNNSGGTLTLPSPTHVHHVDVGSAVRSLRRSLSRSPSKFNLARTASGSSESSCNSPPTPSPESPCPQPSHPGNSNPSLSTGASATPQQPSPFATPFKSSVKLSLRSARPKPTLPKPVSRPRVSPKSPLKRALSITSDSGNAPAPSSSASSSDSLGQENAPYNYGLGFSPAPRVIMSKPSRHSMHLDLSGSSTGSASKFLDAKADPAPPAAAVASPLKRSDAIMDFDHSNLGSPVAKRRSLHGISSLGHDFNVFDYAPAAHQHLDIHEDNNPEYQLTNSASPGRREQAPSPTPPAAVLPKRSSSLRKSTLQQRHDPRSSWGRRQGEKYLAQQSNDMPAPGVLAPGVRTRPRASLDQFLPPEPRESPFTARGPLPNPSAHFLERAHQPHPLSRTLTTSSSGSSFVEDSPTHIPMQQPERSRHASIFTRSLPLGARPPTREPLATPNYKSAMPLQSAFASAGLVSKMNHNAEDDPAQLGRNKPLIMPDTPCKKQVYPSNTYPPSSGSGRKQQRYSLPAPETPFNNALSQPRGTGTFGSQDQAGGLFKLKAGHGRKASLLSLDGDTADYMGTADGDFPPTPTKSVLSKNFEAGNISSNIHTTTTPVAIRTTVPPPTSAFGPGGNGRAPLLSCKLNPLGKSPTQPDLTQGPRAEEFDAIRTPVASRVISVSLPSLSQSQARQELLSTPPPVETEAGDSPPAGSKKKAIAKLDFVTVASPLDRLGFERESPKTPQESMAPPDPSRLSISNSQDGHGLDHPPATPTAPRDEYGGFVDRRVSITPVNGHGANDVDESLGLRFDKVELVGKGEFSQVFRVTTTVSAQPSGYFGAATPSRRTSPSVQVYAVKKMRLPFYGQKDRASKLREVAALEAVRDRENVLQIVDHWEHHYHLYIQTEFCDEGSLDSFLRKVGELGRLDDFRIWKIMLEVCQGLRYVHDAGFVHLDLKPANVFITYEGHLKIGDFGMAAQWPVAKGTEGEGDREYMGPEILRGKFDKPADIFALGLIVLEIACNVFLPDNGPVWVALREGDLSVVSSLTGSEDSAIPRDATGMPIPNDTSSYTYSPSGLSIPSTSHQEFPFDFGARTHNASDLFSGSADAPDALHPPDFMINQYHHGSLDSLVSWMISPDPQCRPTVHQILETDSLRWVYGRRRAAATVYEGNWGPREGSVAELENLKVELDTEMTDV